MSLVFKASFLKKKIRLLTLTGRVEKNAKKRVGKKCKKYFCFCFRTKNQDVTNVIIYIHFQGLFKNTVFRSVGLVTKKLKAILDFFLHGTNFYRPVAVPYPMH